MEWSGMEPHSIVWFCKKKNGMEWNVMEPIPSNTTNLTNFSFPPIWSVFNGMKHINNTITISSLYFLFHFMSHVPSFFFFSSIPSCSHLLSLLLVFPTLQQCNPIFFRLLVLLTTNSLLLFAFLVSECWFALYPYYHLLIFPGS